MTVLLASDVCRLILRRQPPELLGMLQSWSAEGREIVVSAITYAELVAAALLTSEQQRHMELVEAFCARLDAVVPWDSVAVTAYTELQRAIMHEKRVLNMNDVMIAAQALSLDAELLSGSQRSFEGMAGLRLVTIDQDGRLEAPRHERSALS